MLQHTSSEVIIFQLQTNLNSKNTTVRIVVSAALFSWMSPTPLGGALRDIPKNGCGGDYCTDWELTKLIDIKRQENANKVSHCHSFKKQIGDNL